MRPTIRARVFRLAFPAAGEMVVATSMFLVNTAWVGRLGAAQLAAAAAGGLFVGMVQNIFASFCGAKVALLARAVGEGDLPRAKRIAEATLAVTLIAGIAVAAAGFAVASPLAHCLGLEAEVAAVAARYLRIMFLGAPFLFLLINHKFILRASGDTKSPFYATCVALALVAALDPILIFGLFGAPRMGVEGAAVALVVASFFPFLVLRSLLARRADLCPSFAGALRPDRVELARLFRVGFPAILEPLVTQGGYLVFIRMVASLGTVPFAGHEVALTVESVSFMPGFGFALAASILVGQSLGRGKARLAQAAALEAVRQAALVMTSVGLLFLLFPAQIARLFTNDPEVIAAAALCIRLAFLEQTSLGIAMVCAGVHRGAGDTKKPLYTALLSSWCLRIPLTAALTGPFGLGLTGVWIATAADWGLRATLLLRSVRKGAWMRVKV